MLEHPELKKYDKKPVLESPEQTKYEKIMKCCPMIIIGVNLPRRYRHAIMVAGTDSLKTG